VRSSRLSCGSWFSLETVKKGRLIYWGRLRIPDAHLLYRWSRNTGIWWWRGIPLARALPVRHEVRKGFQRRFQKRYCAAGRGVLWSTPSTSTQSSPTTRKIMRASDSYERLNLPRPCVNHPRGGLLKRIFRTQKASTNARRIICLSFARSH